MVHADGLPRGHPPWADQIAVRRSENDTRMARLQNDLDEERARALPLATELVGEDQSRCRGYQGPRRRAASVQALAAAVNSQAPDLEPRGSRCGQGRARLGKKAARKPCSCERCASNYDPQG